MLTPPTDRLHKFMAIAGLALALGGVTGALRQYADTGLQEAEFIGKVAKVRSVYNRFATEARAQIARTEKLGTNGLSPAERATLQAESQKFRDLQPTFDREFADAEADAQRYQAIAQHLGRMESIWLFVAGTCLCVGGFVSYKGFRVWWSRRENEA
jgi:hypothetical protein